MRKISAVQINKEEWYELLKKTTEDGKLLGVDNWNEWIYSVDFVANIDTIFDKMLRDEYFKEQICSMIDVENIVDFISCDESNVFLFIYEVDG